MQKMSTQPVVIAETDAAIARCHPVLAQLRPHVAAAEFVGRVRRQMAGGYVLASLDSGGQPVAVAGYRFGENLHHGRYLYVDDLATDEPARSTGAGRRLFEWLIGQARAADCAALLLDSGVQRYRAHRFYLREGMEIRAHHFVLDL